MHAPSSARLPRLSFGVGDRFAHQAAAQLAAFERLEADGVLVAPVWNKSNREHGFVGSQPPSVRAAAAQAVEERGWGHPWFVDADHIRLETVDRFLDTSDFFTIDVADSIGNPAPAAEIAAFVARHPELTGTLNVAGVAEPLVLTADIVAAIAGNYLLAAREAGAIHRHIAARKGGAGFVTEVSMDETESPQTPRELLVDWDAGY